ncbi:radical SAM protein [Paraburkholderia guartelaensis]|uniref:Radical SAM protein n=1 Tax=Paraburkholderia guartelaensis TaxID=2546446 RepID=A0A4R5L3D6_9BURK|nr:radical SAM protein [Paraburkholderia guartelaensis]TDG02174.1 radical SAM protein [Paraburkholderia guartelaensis]
MAYIVVCIATRWGSALGGINVFNTGLATGISKVLPKPSECICVVEKKPTAELPSNIALIAPPQWTDEAVASGIFEAIGQRRDIEEMLIVGHDLYTGQMAVNSAMQLQVRMGRTPVRSAVISHMDYGEYARRKGHNLEDVEQRSSNQLANIASAEFAFAVGPLLSNSFQGARSERGDKVIPLIPGAANIDPQPAKSTSLSFFIGGRLGLEDDQIKNGVLSVRAVLDAYRQSDRVDRWKTRGHFYACGVDAEKDAELLNVLKTEVRQDASFEIEAIPFSDRQDDVHQRLVKCDVALMPSWHEGFGLAGWEAICAGVPLVCTSQSGLALFIDELRNQLPEEKFRSIEFIQLTGGSPAGMPNDQDINALSKAVRNVIADYPARKAAALSLALHVGRLFTWESCASSLIAPLNWPLANSDDWWQRQRAADAASGSNDGVKSADMVLEALAACRNGQVQSNWKLICSALNLISDRGAKVKLSERQTLKRDVLVIAQAISTALEKRPVVLRLPIVDTVFLDLCWRYLAAASRVATSLREFAELLPGGMRQEIFGDGFLRREILFYVCRFAQEFDGGSEEQASEFLAPLTSVLADDPPLLVRFARLSTIYPSLLRLIPLSGNVTFDAEKSRCAKTLSRPFDLSRLLGESPDLAPTALALSSLLPDLARQPFDQPIGFVKRLNSTYATLGAWRGDKRLAAAMLTVTLSSGDVLAVLESMAGDEEEAIRWAALDLAFSPILRSRLEAMEKDASGVKTLRTDLGKIVDTAVTTGGVHPWLAREFLSHYLDEFATPTTTTAQFARFTLADFPKSRLLLGPVVGGDGNVFERPMHPEVESLKARVGEAVKRVLLVLPPISVGPSSGRAASKTSTPPLGLGLVATHISQQGHDVHLVDCHRFPHLTKEVTQLAKTFDLIGFNTVFSTVRATQLLLRDIRGATQRPMIVIGGPAANLDAWRHSAQDQEDLSNWDFAVSDNALFNLNRLVDALRTTDPWPTSHGVVANTYSKLVGRRDVNLAAPPTSSDSDSNHDRGWMNVQLDRRLYAGPNGQYEPGRTRGLEGRVHEAHIVMSKGCDWNCSFCTERRELSGGERRRDVESVLQEVRQLAMTYTNLRIQFVDDNLFPQIASPHTTITREAGETWATRFLRGLKQIRDELKGNLSWRGIFRFEDFAAYELLGEAEEFVHLLSAAGCNMLAFGVESGVEARRHSIKAGGREFTNDVITSLFRRLRSAGIFTKAYFIIGGKKETAESTAETITFAVKSGATLAYFALYKDFVPAREQLRKDNGVGAASTSSLLEYEQLMTNWDELFSASATTGVTAHAIPRPGLQTPASAVEYKIYQELAEMGFRFEDLVKYNDYHADNGPARSVLHGVTWGNPDQFFGLVEKAYREFYLRREFVTDFKELIAAGY